jgi:putative transcriptional regulator
MFRVLLKFFTSANSMTPLKTKLNELKISVYALARKVGMNEANIGLIVRGTREPKVGTALKIARALSVPVEQIFEIPPEPVESSDATAPSIQDSNQTSELEHARPEEPLGVHEHVPAMASGDSRLSA